MSRTPAHGRVLEALLRSSEPSVRWKTRVQVLGEAQGSRAIRALEQQIRKSARVRALLSRRGRLGRPGTARSVGGLFRDVQQAHSIGRKR